MPIAGQKVSMTPHPFGTQRDLDGEDYLALRHSIYAVHPKEEDLRVTIGSEFCKQPYSASIFNISAMSFGSLSSNAIKALNLGAKKGKFFHNTGEGGISPYHLQGGDICWQIGTGYFGCRDEEGNFNPDMFQEKAKLPEVKLIEIKNFPRCQTRPWRSFTRCKKHPGNRLHSGTKSRNNGLITTITFCFLRPKKPDSVCREIKKFIRRETNRY